MTYTYFWIFLNSLKSFIKQPLYSWKRKILAQGYKTKDPRIDPGSLKIVHMK